MNGKVCLKQKRGGGGGWSMATEDGVPPLK